MSQPNEAVANKNDEELGKFKDYLSEPRFRIKLDDEVNATVRTAVTQLSGEKFPLSTPQITGDVFATRLAAYEQVVKPLQVKTVLLGKWATPEQLPTLTNMLARISEGGNTHSGQPLWIELRLYPLSLLLYSAGIASLAAGNYRAFAAAQTTTVYVRTQRMGISAVAVVPVADAMLEVANTNVWKGIEEFKRMHVPWSEYLFKTLRPTMEELLFLGAGYERLFDQYEVLKALIYADATDGGWGPVGRFGWKYCRGDREDNPFAELRSEAAKHKDGWGLFQAGLFRSSHARFEQTAAKYEKELLCKLRWI
jgi:hypothetical protein